MSGHPGAVLCGQYHGAVDHAVKGHGQLFVGYPIFVKGHHFLAARKTPTSYAPDATRALTPRSLNVKLGPRRKGHKGRAVWLA